MALYLITQQGSNAVPLVAGLPRLAVVKNTVVAITMTAPVPVEIFVAQTETLAIKALAQIAQQIDPGAVRISAMTFPSA